MVKPRDSHGENVLAELAPWLRERGRETVALRLPHEQEKVPPVDMILILGGDGTLLSVARLVEGTDIPILGINLGSLGFLTEVTLNELYTVLEDVLEHKYTVDHRLMLKSTVRRETQLHPQTAALNDVVIKCGTHPKMIRLDIFVNKQFVTHLQGDGLIIASPTGSTAYSLSSGGPIIHPSVNAILLTPISPHMLSNRPIVISDNKKVEVVIQTEGKNPAVTFDGQVSFPLQKGDVVEVTKSEKCLKLITSPKRDYYQILREKLKWGEG